MAAYFGRRLLLIIPTFLGVTLLVFTVTRLAPGGPIERMLQEMIMASETSPGNTMSHAAQSLTPEDLEQLKAYYGFDKPILAAYFDWLKNLFVLEFGTSTRYNVPVWHAIRDRLPVSTYFGVWTMILVYLISIPLGVIKALKHASFLDYISSILLVTAYAIPGYVIGIFLLMSFSVHWEFFPLGEFTSDDFENFSFFGKIGDLLSHTALPIISYVIGSFAVMTMLMKNTLMENLSADYVRTAIAKGVPFRMAVIKHAIQNSVIPLATHFGNNISIILTGSFLIETIFNIDGIGLLSFTALLDRDYPIVMAIMTITSILLMVGNILSDICVALVDPRVRFE